MKGPKLGKSLIPFSFFLCQASLAFTLVSATPPKYSVDDVFIDFAADSCSNTGYTAAELHNLAEEAVNEYWNKVTTSRLVLKKGSMTSFSSDGLSLDDLAGSAGANRILMGCNDDISSFAGGAVGAIGGIKSSGGTVTGAVLLNDHITSALPSLSRSELLALMAHELGHALGIGHSSDETAIMYYSIGGKIQEQMTQDDYDALTYLYPNEKKLMGLAGSCGTTQDLQQDHPSGLGGPFSGSGHFAMAFLLAFFLSRFFTRPVFRWSRKIS